MQAAIFGDGNSLNGVEDQRLSQIDIETWPKEFKSVGRIYCAGVVQGSAILFKQHREGGKLTPGLLTAKHVTDGFDVRNCAFTPEGDTWRRAGVVSVSAKGASADSSPITLKYAKDWVVLELSPWRGWQQYAINLGRSAVSTAEANLSNTGAKQAYMVGFDSLRNKVVAHFNCHLGLPDQSELLSGYAELYWDDCDSAQGSSGGALFIKAEGSYELIGLRVGSLFDEARVGKDPEMGSKFDINTNINVTRAISNEMFEPVGSTGSLVEN